MANNKNKVISVNLPEVLLSDLELIQHQGLSRDSVSICRTKYDLTAFFESHSSKLAMICASDSNILKCQPIDIFVNIASFQEMPIMVIEKYFDIIQSSINGAYLYCCNRKEKILIGGEVLSFYDYPWSNYSEILIDEPCPWHLLFYTAFVKTYIPLPHIRRKYDGIILHRLVKYPAHYS